LGLLATVFVVFSVAFAAAGYGYYLQQSAHLDTQLRSELQSVSDLKSQQVSGWLADIDANARVNAKSPYLAVGVDRFLNDPTSGELRRGMYERLAAELEAPGFRSVCLLDGRLGKRMEAGDWCTVVGPDVRSFASEAMRTGRVVQSGLYRGQDCGQLHLDFLIPIVTRDGKKPRVAAVILERVDPTESLFPKLESWPGSSKSAETLLVERLGGSLAFVKPPRSEQARAPADRPPLESQQLASAMASGTAAEIVSAVDYRGVPVIASVRSVPGTPWFVVAKVDQEDLDRPLQQQSTQTVSVGLAVLLLASLSVGLLWRDQTTQFDEELYRADVERQVLSQHVAYLTKYANDIIVLADEELRIVDVNDRAVDAYGYEREELIGKEVRDLRTPEARNLFSAVLHRLDIADGVVYETVHQRKDGSMFPIESSVRVVGAEGGKSYQFILRDITDRKLAQRQVEDHRRKLKALASELSLAEERERRRLAIGLHDQIGQALAMAKIRLGSLKASTGDAGTGVAIQEVSDSLDLVIQETRTLTFELSPPILYELGLEAAIEWLADRMAERYGLECVTEGDDNPKPLEKDASVVLFGVVRELLVNVVKHARATKVRISVSADAEKVRIVVSDDGVGFDTAAMESAEGPAGFGLFSISERLDNLGGCLVLDSRPGEGTVAVLVAPLESPSSDEGAQS
jgi:PAS domain S-box-containing protein